VPETPDTDHFGLTRVGEGEQLSKNGFAALDLDRVTVDDMLYALSLHTHSAEPRLASPAGAPALIGRPTGGTLPPNVTLYYRISYLDKWGLETAGSSEASITTSGAINSPSAIAGTIETSGGTLTSGLYAYVATFATPSGGETVPGPRTEVRIESGSTNRTRLVLPDLAPGSAFVRIYRSRPGQTQYYFLFETDANNFYDDGSLTEDTTVTIPGFNSTNSANSVEVTVPGGLLPPGVFGWKLYRSVTPSTYAGFNLVHVVVEGTTETSNDIRTSWQDTGEALQRGEPRQVSSTMSGGATVELAQLGGKFPLSATPRGSRSWDPFVPGPVTMEREYARFYSSIPISPTQVSAFFLAAPNTTPTGSQVAFRVVDSLGKFVAMSTDGSNGNFYTARYPLTDVGVHEAEKGTRSATGVVPIVTDLKANNGQSVEVNDINEYVEVALGILDPGRYRAFAKVRNTTPGTTPPINDINIAVLNATTSAIIAERNYTLALLPSGDYVEIGDLPFRPPVGVPVKIRLSKNSADAATYLVDQFRYAAELQSLAAGFLSLVAGVGDIPDTDYPRATPPTQAHLTFDETHALVIAQGATPTGTAIVTARTSDLAAVSLLVSSDQPWLTVAPAVGNASTLAITATVDFSSLNPGSRTVGTITISNGGATPTHLPGTVKIVALKAPSATGSDVNVTVHY
jgi:hypothetical protein